MPVLEIAGPENAGTKMMVLKMPVLKTETILKKC